ncbi:MAG: hypothetical protein H7838_07980 [Magnetococcus sp. DMHC-8]
MSTPEEKLWSAVLKQAIVDLEDPLHRGKALGWIKSKSDEIGSFQWVCFTLDKEPLRMRERIFARYKAVRQMARMQQRAPRRFRELFGEMPTE